ncbi:acyl carrier protein [Streptomyces sp. NRRL B-1677]|uniref:acyl carrier protein n=1 Tax=Streptomyces sp. NRRL B-1677 TaxID=2682966 RepID=UPI001892C78A|nr:phosphopantetheine-binding protein [Streptomyces sp. NRRL B-1677]MBF6048376.1 acyl carrier protein [Streptomyces sp. NRRL B-1677]
MNTILEHITTVLTEKFEVPADRITPRTMLKDLDLDSLALVELQVTLQEDCNIPLDESTVTPELTLGELAGVVTALAGPEQESGHA